MRLNLLSQEKSVSAGSLFHVLITRSQKKVVRIFRLFDFLNNLNTPTNEVSLLASCYLSRMGISTLCSESTC